MQTLVSFMPAIFWAPCGQLAFHRTCRTASRRCDHFAYSGWSMNAPSYSTQDCSALMLASSRPWNGILEGVGLDSSCSATCNAAVCTYKIHSDLFHHALEEHDDLVLLYAELVRTKVCV